MYQTQRAAYLSELSTNRYRIAEDVATKIAAEPEKALPELLAQVHMNAYEDAMQEVYRILPQLVPHYIRSHTESETLEKQFFEKFPGLRAHMPDVVETARLLRQRPGGAKMSSDMLMQQVGTIVSISKGIPLPGAAPAAPAATPAAPRAPFAPASPGGGTGAVPSAPPTNPFSALADEIRREDY